MTTETLSGLLTLKDVCRLLKVAERTARRMLATEALPKPIRFNGRVIRFSEAEIAAWLAAGAPPRHIWERSRNAKGGAR